MKKIIAIQSNSLKEINIKTDTTLLLALEAQQRGYKIIWYETKDLNLIKSKIIVYGKIVKFFRNKKNFYKIIKNIKFNLNDANFILIRQNPPFNEDYINSTYYLDYLNPKKVINNPTSVRNVSEKFFSSKFLIFMPETIFTKNFNEISEENMDIALKALAAHTSQVPPEAIERVRAWKAENGKKHNMKYAESFRTFTLR